MIVPGHAVTSSKSHRNVPCLLDGHLHLLCQWVPMWQLDLGQLRPPVSVCICVYIYMRTYTHMVYIYIYIYLYLYIDTSVVPLQSLRLEADAAQQANREYSGHGC